MKELWVVVALAASAGLGACVKRSTLAREGFHDAEVGIALPYLDPANGTFLPADWELDNYYLDGDRWALKEGPEWLAWREFDDNNDGSINEWEKKEEPIYDLHFTNRRDNGIIWIKVHPVHPRDNARRLSVIMGNYADSLAGTKAFTQGSLFSLRTIAERQNTTFVVDAGPTRVDGHDAYTATIEIAEVAKLTSAPRYRDAKIRLVFAKFARLEEPSSQGPYSVVEHDGREVEIHVKLLVIGYYNTVDRFHEHLADFEALRSRIRLPDAQYLKGFAEPVPPAPASPPAPAETLAPPVSQQAPTPPIRTNLDPPSAGAGDGGPSVE